MCCIFTCCGWMIDLIQRLWTFTMSCCISSAICCFLITASLSGVALGYNYSLAEYIDLKETNVSVYLKRGVFDDEIADDMNWRRSGHMPVAGHIGEANLRTGAPDNEDMPLKSDHRLDDSVIESDDQNKYESSLMRLTVKAPDPSTTTSGYTSDPLMPEIIQNYPKGSLDQLKAIHGLLNMRRSNNAQLTTIRHKSTVKTTEEDKYAPPYGPGFVEGPGPLPNHVTPLYPVLGQRRMMDYPDLKKHINVNPARFAVPDKNIGSAGNWYFPKMPEKFPLDYYDANVNSNSKPLYPPPVTYRTGPIRPTRPTLRPTPTHTEVPVRTSFVDSVFIKSTINFLPEKLRENILNKIDLPSYMNKDVKSQNQESNKSEPNDYEDYAAKGIPVRRKRYYVIDNESIKSKVNSFDKSVVTSVLKIGRNENKTFLNRVFGDKLHR